MLFLKRTHYPNPNYTGLFTSLY